MPAFNFQWHSTTCGSKSLAKPDRWQHLLHTHHDLVQSTQALPRCSSPHNIFLILLAVIGQHIPEHDVTCSVLEHDDSDQVESNLSARRQMDQIWLEMHSWFRVLWLAPYRKIKLKSHFDWYNHMQGGLMKVTSMDLWGERFKKQTTAVLTLI